MDFVTHTLAAAAMGAAGYPQWGRRGVMGVVAAAQLPELERWFALGGPAVWVQAAYGAGHSVFTVPVLALLLVASFQRWLGGWRRGLGAAAAGLLSHVGLDLVSGPGVRLLWPLGGQFYGLSVVARYDVLLLGVLAVALVGPALLNLVNQDIGASRYQPQRAARVGLAAAALLVAGRGVIYLIYESRVAPPSTAGYVLTPSPFHPLTWYVITDLGPAYTVEEFRLGTYGQPLRFRKAEPNRAFETAADTPLAQAFLSFAVFPQYTLERGARGMLVRIHDMRFYSPGGDNREYSVEIEVTPQLQVVAQRARM